MTDKFLNYTGLTRTINNIKTALSSKVDKEAGKGLSSEDFTAAEKAKLASISNTEETLLIDWTEATNNRDFSIDFDQFSDYNTFIILIFVNVVRSSGAVSSQFNNIDIERKEFSKTELLKINDKVGTNSWYNSSPAQARNTSDSTNYGYPGQLWTKITRPQQDSIGVGRLDFECIVYRTTQQTSSYITLSSLQYCMYAK